MGRLLQSPDKIGQAGAREADVRRRGLGGATEGGEPAGASRRESPGGFVVWVRWKWNCRRGRSAGKVGEFVSLLIS